MNAIASYFKFQERGTTFGTEVRAGPRSPSGPPPDALADLLERVLEELT